MMSEQETSAVAGVTLMSGKVAIIDAVSRTVLAVRDLGPKPVQVKRDTVLPLVEIMPEDASEITGYTDEVTEASVRRIWHAAD